MVSPLLLAVLLAPPASGPWQLDCLMTDAAEQSSPVEPPTPVTLQMEVRGRRIVSVAVDGPPIISSFAGLASFSGSQDSNGAITVTERRPQPRQLRWRASLQGETLQLRRGDSEILLNPDTGVPGAYSGTWRTQDRLEGHILLSGGGGLRCPADGTQSNGTPS